MHVQARSSLLGIQMKASCCYPRKLQKPRVLAYAHFTFFEDLLVRADKKRRTKGEKSGISNGKENSTLCKPGGSAHGERANFAVLVLLCIDASNSESGLIFWHFSRSTRFSLLRTAPKPKFQKKMPFCLGPQCYRHFATSCNILVKFCYTL